MILFDELRLRILTIFFIDGIPPYTVRSYREPGSVEEEDATRTISCTRHGRVWTENEVARLSHDIFREWEMDFSLTEEDIPDELSELVTTYF